MIGMTEVLILGALGVATILFLMLGSGMIGGGAKHQWKSLQDEDPKHSYHRD